VNAVDVFVEVDKKYGRLEKLKGRIPLPTKKVHPKFNNTSAENRELPTPEL